MAAKKKKKSLTPKARTLVILSGVVQIGLIGIAHGDLAKRDDSEVLGNKRVWRWITLVDFIGPLIYFVAGRKSSK